MKRKKKINTYDFWDSIDDKALSLFILTLIWCFVFGIFLKIYNGIVYPLNYHGSFQNILKAPLLSFRYFEDYWSNPFNIILHVIGIVPPLISYLLLAFSSYAIEREANKPKIKAVETKPNQKKLAKKRKRKNNKQKRK